MKINFKFLGIVLAFVLFIEYYCFVAFTNAVSTLSKPIRRWTIVVYIVLTLLSWLSLFWLRYVSHHSFPQNVKAVLLASMMGFVVGKLMIAVLMFCGDLIRGIQWMIVKFSSSASELTVGAAYASPSIARSVFLSRIALLAGGLLFSGFLWGITNRYRYQLKKVKLTIKDLPNELKGLKIVQISDVHAGSFDNHHAVEEGVKMILAQKADLIVFTGDLVNDLATEIEPYMDIFSQLKAPLGVFSTLGNHDYGDYAEWPSAESKRENLEKLKQHHQTMGWKLLMNEHVILNKDGGEFALLGVENWSASSRFPKHGRMDLAYAGLENKNMFKLLLSHDPSHWDAEIRPKYQDIDLTLAGHTHGMQFGIELPWFKWSPVQYLYKEWAGLYKEDLQHLYVNRGYGFLGYQGRLGVLPEVTVIELA